MNSIKDMDEAPKYKLGIALSGGGARGLAHAGALQAIEDAGLKPDVIAGVSAGSVVAVLYAAGVSPKQILEIFTTAKVSDFTDLSFKGGGLLRIDKFKKIIMRCIPDFHRLEDLHIPTYIGVTDFDNGEACEFHEGDIADIMIASCSIPIVFPPVTIGGTKYVDGGVLRNMPSWIIRDKCEQLIGVNVSPMNHVKVGNNVFDIAMRTYSLMAKSNQRADMQMCDLSIELKEISHHKVFSLKEIQRVYVSGYAHMHRELRERGWWNPAK